MNAKRAKKLRKALRVQLGVDRIEGHPDGYMAKAIKGWLVNRGERGREPIIDIRDGTVMTDFATRVNKYRALVHPGSSRAAYHKAKRGEFVIIPGA